MSRREKEPYIPFEGDIPFGSAVRARRGAIGLTLDEFCQRLGNYNPGHISKIENGLEKPSKELVETITDILILDKETQLTNPNRDDVLIWMQRRDYLIGKRRGKNRNT